MDDVRAVLQQSFLGVLPEAVRHELAKSARIVELPAGKLIYDPQLSVVLNGMLRAFVDDGSGRHLTVSYLQAPMAAGIGVAAGLEFPMAFQAVTESSLLRLSQVQFADLRQNHPEVGWTAAEELARYLDDLLAEITRVAFLPVRARVAHHLLALAGQEGSGRHAVHQAELATAVGSVREVVGRTLGGLREAGLVEVSATGVTPVDQEGLRHVAGQHEK